MVKVLGIICFLLTECVLLTQKTTAFSSKKDSTFVPGKITEKVISQDNPNERYSVFLPMEYSTHKKWPIIFIMDPRGRALPALNLFRDAAEELGYILMSSYNTVSDGPAQPNAMALNAMIHDAARQFSVNDRRFYLAGFSGTARIAWSYAHQLKNNVAGVIGFGAGLSNNILLPVAVKAEGNPFSFFGGAAYYDFNFFEVFNLANQLSDLDFPNAIEFYDGVHGWPSSKIIRDALYWMELRAMKEHLQAIDPQIIKRYMEDQLRAGSSLEQTGHKYEAYRRYKIALEASDLLVENSALRKQVKRMEKDQTIKKEAKSLKSQSRETDRYLGKMAKYLSKVRQSQSVPTPLEIRKNLLILNLMLDAEVKDRSYENRASRVMLENAYVRLSFYEPRYYLESQKPEWALAMLKVAQQIKPNAPQNCLFLARTYAQLDQAPKAFDALGCLDDLNILSYKMLETDPYLQKLAQNPRMNQLKQSLKLAEK